MKQEYIDLCFSFSRFRRDDKSTRDEVLCDPHTIEFLLKFAHNRECWMQNKQEEFVASAMQLLGFLRYEQSNGTCGTNADAWLYSITQDGLDFLASKGKIVDVLYEAIRDLEEKRNIVERLKRELSRAEADFRLSTMTVETAMANVASTI